MVARRTNLNPCLTPFPVFQGNLRVLFFPDQLKNLNSLAFYQENVIIISKFHLFVDNIINILANHARKSFRRLMAQIQHNLRVLR